MITNQQIADTLIQREISSDRPVDSLSGGDEQQYGFKEENWQDTSGEQDGGFNFTDSLWRQDLPFSGTETVEKQEKIIPESKTATVFNKQVSSNHVEIKEELANLEEISSPDSGSFTDSASYPFVDTALNSKTQQLAEMELINPKEPELRNPSRPVENWMTVSILMLVVLLTLVRTLHRKRFRQLFNAFFNNRFIRQMLREEQLLTNRATILLSVIYLMTLSLFVIQVEMYFQLGFIESHGFSGLLNVALAILLFYIAKIFVIKISAGVLKIQNTMNEHLFNYFLFNKMLALVLIAIVTGVSFLTIIPAGYLIKTGLVIIGVFYIARLLKSFFIGISSTGISWFYIFLYLCTLEILPLVVLLKVLINRIY